MEDNQSSSLHQTTTMIKKPSHLPSLQRDPVVAQFLNHFVQLWINGSRNLSGNYTEVLHRLYPSYPICHAYAQWIGQAGRAFEIAMQVEFNELFSDLKSCNWRSHLESEAA